MCRIFNNFATEYIYEEKATAAFVSLSNRNSKDMSKASWLPAHVYGNGYVGIGSKGICSWVIAETREILLLYTILFAHVLPLFLSRLTAYYMCLLSIIKTETKNEF